MTSIIFNLSEWFMRAGGCKFMRADRFKLYYHFGFGVTATNFPAFRPWIFARAVEICENSKPKAYLPTFRYWKAADNPPPLSLSLFHPPLLSFHLLTLPLPFLSVSPTVVLDAAVGP